MLHSALMKPKGGLRGRSALAGILSALLVAYACLTSPGERLELQSQDFRLASVAKGVPPDPKILIVEVGASTASKWDDPVVFWDRHYAHLVTHADALGAKLIAFDSVSTYDPDEFLDRLGAPETAERPLQSFVGAVSDAKLPVVIGFAHDSTGAPLPPVPYLRTNPLLRANVGSIDLYSSEDGAIRSVPLQQSSGGSRIPSFAALIAARSLSIDPEGNLAKLAPARLDDDRGTRILVNYPEAHFRTLEASKLEGQNYRDFAQLVSGSLILVGAAYKESQDVHATNGARAVAGVEIQARAVATLLHGASLRRFAPAVEGLITLGAGLLCVAASYFGRPSAARFAIILAAFAVPPFFATSHDLLLPLVFPTLACVVVPVVGSAVRALDERLARANIERLFGQHLSPEILRYLLASSTADGLESAEVDATVLFLDVRGSTRLAERHGSPSAVIDLLNQFFGASIPEIERHGGLVNRMLGDGFLAVFGAPYPLENHAAAAVNAAEAIRRSIEELNAHLPEGDRWRYGCGIHTGAVVMGNLGAKNRNEFTLIGDTVNVASRLESLSKELQVVTVLSAETWEAAGQPSEFNGPIQSAIAGREASMSVYVR